MPRIDPLKLLTCLKVLLAPNGGIRSANEVKRLAELMAKYSKKLVSKCIYIQILKSTDTELLGKFMGVGGWLLTHMWLNEAIKAANWPLVQEILELLLLCPVDVQRLRSNTAPKLVKGLSKDGGNEGVRILATKLVEQWLKIVKGETMAAEMAQNAQAAANVASTVGTTPTTPTNGLVPNAMGIQKPTDGASQQGIVSTPNDSTSLVSPTSKLKEDDGLVYKIVVKDGKQMLAKIANSGGTPTDPTGANAGEVRSRNLSIDEGDSNASGNLDMSNRDSDNKDGYIDERDSKDREGDREKSKSSKDRDRHRDHKSSSSSSSRHKSSSSKSSSSKSSSSSSSKSKSSSHSSSSSSSKHKDKESSDKDRHKSSSSSSKTSSSSSSRDKDRDKNKDRSRDKERERSRSSSDKDRSRSDRDKDKEKEKSDKERSSSKDDSSPSREEKDKPQSPTGATSPMTIDKLGKIPKKPREEEPVVTSITIPSKKASMSIEIRRDANRPKTVKTYNSQFRSHGLSEEAPPPPSRKGLKKPPPQPVPGTSIPPSLPALKRASPPPSSSPTTTSASTTVKESLPPAEKKLKIDLTTAPAAEKPGAVKFIAPKPKPSTLVESDMFMDALSAAAPKKDVRKRKRRPSGSKEPGGKDPSTSDDPESPVSGKVTPLKFYQDTLEDSDKAELADDKDDWDDRKNEDEDDIPLKKVKEQIEEKVREEKELEERRMRETEEPEENPVKKPPGPGCGPDGPPGVLMLHRRKGPKKKLTWRVQEQLEEIRYFELDENERVNVTKTFTDMKQMERFNEREAFMLARKLNADDVMVEQTPWVALIEIDDVPPHPEGMQSKEKKIQMERELTTLKALYFTRHMIPESPSEPDMEQYQITEPAVIPLDDITGNPDAVNDFTSMPWPDPKGSPPQEEDFMANTEMAFPGGQFNPFLPFAPPGTWMGPTMNNGPPNGMMPPPPMGGPMGNFNPMMPGPPGNMMMNGGPPPPNMMMGGPPDDMGMNCNMNMMNPGFGGPGGPGPNFGAPPPNGGMAGGFNNYGPPMGMNPNAMNMNMNNGPPRGGGGGGGGGPRGGNWRSGSAGPPGGNDVPGGGSWRGGGRGGGGGNNQRRGGGGGAGGGPRGENRGICKQFQRGFCRNGNKCNYFHPPGNPRF